VNAASTVRPFKTTRFDADRSVSLFSGSNEPVLAGARLRLQLLWLFEGVMNSALGRGLRRAALIVALTATSPLASQNPTPTSPSGPSPTSAQKNPDFNAAGDPNNQIQVVIPDTIPAIVDELRVRDARIRDLIGTGSFATIYLPAFEAKALALALDARRGELPSDAQPRVERAVQQLVRSAWLLDAFGDLGNKDQIRQAYEGFGEAVSQLDPIFPRTR
jgi:hypothetical protein